MRRLSRIEIVAIIVPVLIWSVALYMLYENYRCDYCPKYPDPELYNLDGECKFYSYDRCIALCEFTNMGKRNLTDINLDIIYDVNQTARHAEELLQPNETIKADLEVPCRDDYFIFIASKEAWILYKQNAELIENVND